MNVEVFFNVDDKAARRFLTDMERRQIPFAAALGMNNTMKMAQGDVRREYERRFTTRNSSLAKALTTIPRDEFATKKKLRVNMMNVRDTRTGRMAGEGFVERQMAGGIKSARGSAIAIPIIGPGMRRLKGGSIPSGKKAKNNPNLVRVGNTLFERQKRKGLVPRFTLTKSASPSRRGRFRYIEVAEQTIVKNLNEQFHLAMIRAMRTAR
jgi:hypothetical protein